MPTYPTSPPLPDFSAGVHGLNIRAPEALGISSPRSRVQTLEMASTTIRTDRVGLAVLATRKTGTTVEEFRRHWAEVHGPLVASIEIVKKNILKYEQAYPNAELSAGLKAGGANVPSLDWDGMTIFEAESYAKITLQSDEFKKIAGPDADTFLNATEMRFIPLDLITVVDH
ncbi:hypothetical protein FB45DRAFT_1025624 [Roridomyces roridus]|uniref:EthD domain-containing protein n=1 Tax=Roridomyces roridus TaxID=1738132 RepID=A0AAD7BZ00_9AGAR|nr:hypothetical protein FB45DRAFT_1025624 [Roridomyces roridus]